MKNYARIDESIVVELLSTDGDITEMFHPDLIWVEIFDDTFPAIGWSFQDGVFSPPPPPTSEQLEAAALERRDNLMQWATQQIGPLQDAVDLDEATAEETAKLKAWKQYRVALNRLNQQVGWPTNIQWPTAPEVD